MSLLHRIIFADAELTRQNDEKVAKRLAQQDPLSSQPTYARTWRPKLIQGTTPPASQVHALPRKVANG